jgi:hypothetical protein
MGNPFPFARKDLAGFSFHSKRLTLSLGALTSSYLTAEKHKNKNTKQKPNSHLFKQGCFRFILNNNKLLAVISEGENKNNDYFCFY